MEQLTEAPGRWQRMEALFHRALECPEEERSAKVREWCADDHELLTELLEMLDSSTAVEESLAGSSNAHPGALERRSVAAPDVDLWTGRVLGAFRLDRLLGRGGMGVVYLGSRVSGGFTQAAAIKLMAQSMTFGPAVQQFHRERDALARLEHPNIARLFDAGVAAEGTPFVVMEYIDGRRFDEVLDDGAVPLEEKLRCFVQLCDAVAYVHRNLILHRDLKPGNVMVTAQGQVKLLDFGTLKLMGPQAEVSSEMTQAGMRPVTLRYASPEHLDGKSVSTAADVYSLGMVLYRLLAGQLPQAVEAATVPDDIEALQHARIEPPSTYRPARVATRLSMADLDAIALKAIRFEPGQRYDSAEALAADVTRCLAQEPVAARQGTVRYRSAKFYQRHRVPLRAATAVLVVLSAGLAAMLREGRVARAETLRAEAGVDEERKLTRFVFKDYFDQLREIPGSTSAQRKAATEALSYLDRLASITDSQGLRVDTVEAYRRMSLLQGDPYEQNLGDPAGALKSLDKAEVLAAPLLAKSPGDPGMLGMVALLQRTRSEVLYGLGRTPEAVAEMRSSVSLYERLVSLGSPTVAQLQYASNAYNGLGDELGQPDSAALGDTAGALAAWGRDMELAQRALALSPGYPIARQSIAIAHEKIGQVLQPTDPTAAVKAFLDSMATRMAMPEAEKNTFRSRRGVAINATDLGDAFRAARKYRAAHAQFAEAGATLAAFSAADPKDVRAKHDLAVLLTHDAVVYVDELNPDLNALAASERPHVEQSAYQTLERSVQLLQEISPANNSARRWRALLAYDKVVLGALALRMHRDAGGRLTSEGLADLRQFAAAADISVEELSYATEAWLIAEPPGLRDARFAVQCAERLVSMDRRQNPGTLLLLAQAYRAAGDAGKASSTAAEGLALCAPVKPGDPVPRTRKLLEKEVAGQRDASPDTAG